jgi:hypothetical protein
VEYDLGDDAIVKKIDKRAAAAKLLGAHFLEHASRECPVRVCLLVHDTLGREEAKLPGRRHVGADDCRAHSLRYDVLAKKMEADAVKKGKRDAGVQAHLAMQQDAMEEVRFDEYE